MADESVTSGLIWSLRRLVAGRALTRWTPRGGHLVWLGTDRSGVGIHEVQALINQLTWGRQQCPHDDYIDQPLLCGVSVAAAGDFVAPLGHLLLAWNGDDSNPSASEHAVWAPGVVTEAAADVLERLLRQQPAHSLAELSALGVAATAIATEATETPGAPNLEAAASRPARAG